MGRKPAWLVVLFAAACALAWPVAEAGRLLHHRATPFGALYVYEQPGGLRILKHHPRGARQSAVLPDDPDHLELGYTRMALAGLALAPAPRRLLVAGLGGGALPRFLRRNFPEAAVDVVEIEAQVLEVARRFFGFETDSRLQVHIDDARRFIARAPPGGYDVILLDAFADAEVPAHLATAEFLGAVRRALAPHGVLVSNLWYRTENRRYDDMLATHRAVFETVVTLKVRSDVNIIVLALPRPIPLDRDLLAAAAESLARERGLRFALATMVRSGFFEEPDRGARVLRDP